MERFRRIENFQDFFTIQILDSKNVFPFEHLDCFHHVNGIFAVDFCQLDLNDLVILCGNFLSGEIRFDRQFPMPTIDQNRQLNRPHPPEIAKRIQSGADRPAGVKDVIHEHDVVVVNVGRDFCFLHNGLRGHPGEIVPVKIDVQRADLRFWLRLFSHSVCHSAGHRYTPALYADKDDRSAIVGFEYLIRQTIQRRMHLLGLHQLIVEFQRHGGPKLYARLTIMSGVDLSIEVAGIRLPNPVIAASGTFGYGEEFSRFADLRRIGAICVKGTSARPIEGNLPPRLFPTAAGMLNSIGLENVGVDAFIREKLPFLRKIGCAVFVNVFGFNEDEYAEVIEKLNGCDGIAAYELNISCPNTKHGGMAFGQSPAMTQDLTKMLKALARRPLIVKLSPNVTDITAFALAAEDAGADAITVANTYLGMAIDTETFKPRIHSITAGLSGPDRKSVV